MPDGFGARAPPIAHGVGSYETGLCHIAQKSLVFVGAHPVGNGIWTTDV